jgi:hypothetical protein
MFWNINNLEEIILDFLEETVELYTELYTGYLFIVSLGHTFLYTHSLSVALSAILTVVKVHVIDLI